MPPLLEPVRTHDTPWNPDTVKVTLNVALDGCIVPTTAGGARVDYSHLVVLDNFLDEPTRQGLLEALTAPGWTGQHPPEALWERATADAAQRPATWGLKAGVLSQLAAGDLPAKLEVQSRLCKLYPDMLIAHMPSEAIQLGLQPHTHTAIPQQQQQQQQQQHSTQPPLHATTTGTPSDVEAARGVTPATKVPQPCAAGTVTAVTQQEQLPPGHTSNTCTQAAPQQRPHSPTQQQQQQPAQEQHDPQDQEQQRHHADCSWLLANAAVYGDQFSWHVDADPQCFTTPSPWTSQYGLYCNREAGKPLFVSLLVYLDRHWPRGADAETLFLDSNTDTGVFVRPKAYRVVLMDQDVAHRLSTPSAAAHRPRYSLVWKLVMLPKAQAAPQQQQQQGGGGLPAAAACIARQEWGPPMYFGSAAHVLRVAKQSAADQDGKKRRL